MACPVVKATVAGSAGIGVRPRREYFRSNARFRAVCGRIPNIKDSLLERVEFELSGDFLNGQ
jgi:hypothetical protein